MIPHHHALVPCNVYQSAATQAIIDVERKQLRGTHLGQYPYARALFRHLRGGARIARCRYPVAQSGSISLMNTTACQSGRNDNGRYDFSVTTRLRPGNACKSDAAIKLRWRRHKSSWRLLPRAS
ncbi:plasmid SOS inhibition protein A [Salmonella enterica]|nr:plasmid SOS inhibition protein A [Salmonella enterica]